MPISEQKPEQDIFTELPVRLYSALRTTRIYPSSNPQVKKSTDSIIAVIQQILEQKKKDVTIAASEQRILINGKPLIEKDQQRPQVQGLIEIFENLQIHALTFNRYFSTSDCIRLLELLATAAGHFRPEQPIKILLQEAKISSVRVDEKRYVALHEGEQVASEDQIIPEGSFLQISDEEIAEYVLAESGNLSEKIPDLSIVDLQRLFAAVGRQSAPDNGSAGSQQTLQTLVSRLDKKISEGGEKSALLDRSASALAGLTPDILSRLLAALPQKDNAKALLDKTVERLDANQLEALFLRLSGTTPAKGMDQADVIEKRLQATGKAKEIEQTKGRIQDANILIGLAGQPTPPHLLPALQQPDWAAPVLVTALRRLADGQQDTPSPDTFTTLLGRYEKDLSPTVYNQVASRAGTRMATLDEQELGRMLIRRFKGIFGQQLYGTVIAQMSDDKFERIAQELNLLAQKKIDSPLADLDDTEIQAAYQRLMQTVRGEKLRAVLALHQRQQEKEQQLDQEQVRESIRLLLEGDQTVLTDDLFIQALPTSISRLIARDKQEATDQLLTRLVTGLRNNDTAVRRGSAEALGRTAATLVESEQWQRLDKLLPALKQALPFMEDLQAGFQTLNSLESLTRHHLLHKRYNRAINALDPLFDLAIYTDEGSSNLGSHAQICLDRLADPTLLDPLLENIQTDNQHHDNSQYLISRMGAGAANFLMSRLGKSEIRKERELLLKLIEEIGKPARNALLLLLEQDAPWYITRNIMQLFKRIGDPDCFTTIAPYIHHEDVRVQREVIQTIGVIGGSARKKFFLRELTRASIELRPLIVRQLGKIHDESIVLPLTELLLSTAGPPHHEKEQLQTEICIALARLRSKKALPGLKKVIATKIPGLDDYSSSVLSAAQSALHAIDSNSSVFADSVQQENTRQAQQLRKHDPLAEKEATIFHKAARGKTEEAKKELYDLVITCAKNKDFANAERLRERIYEIDPMALTEIIRSGELIEKEKTGAVSHNQLDTWAGLLEKLDTVEFSAIYHELEEQNFSSEEIIVQQGTKNDKLFFINQGSVKISYNKDRRDIFVSTMNRGQIIGENFFDASFWTVTLTALTPVNISILDWDGFNRWQEEYPGLESKLRSFYNQCNITRALLEKKGLDRRQAERIKLSRKIQVQLIDHNKKPIGRGFRGELADIAQGGLSFLIRISKKENTRLLLGRTMRITIPIGGDPGHLQLTGLAIGVQPFELLESDFSVHIRFLDILDQDTLQEILG